MVPAPKTTVRVSKKTLQILEEFKLYFNASSYEEVFLRLAEEYKRKLIEESFGVDKNRITSFTEDDRGEDRE